MPEERLEPSTRRFRWAESVASADTLLSPMGVHRLDARAAGKADSLAEGGGHGAPPSMAQGDPLHHGVLTFDRVSVDSPKFPPVRAGLA